MKTHELECMCADCMTSGPAIDANATEPTLTRDAEHRYWLNWATRKKQILGVSQMLRRTGHTHDIQGFAQGAVQLGTAVDDLLTYADEGRLGEFEIAPAAQPWLDEYLQAKHVLLGNADWTKIRPLDWHRDDLYAGEPDRVAPDLIADIKTGKGLYKHYRVQTALYGRIHNCRQRVIIWLRGTGKFDADTQLVRYEDMTDFDEAERVVRSCQWRAKRS